MKKVLPLLIICVLFLCRLNAQNIYRLSNRFDAVPFDTLIRLKADGTISTQLRKIDHSLKGYITKQSDDRDTLFIKFWHILDTVYKRNGKIPDKHKGDPVLINSNDNDSTFIYKIKWKNNSSFTVPFSATTITATTIPFRYRLKKGSDLEADFLNVGLNVFFTCGKTKFFKQEQIDSRQTYLGWGPFLAFSQVKIDSANTNGKVKTEKQVATLSYGASVIKSWNGFSILLAVGFDNTIGNNAKHWEDNNFKSGLKPWIGFGFGLKLTELSFKVTNSSK